MLKYLRIQTMLLILIAASVVALIGLGMTGGATVRELSKDHQALIERAFPLISQNMTVYKSVSDTARNILSSRNDENKNTDQLQNDLVKLKNQYRSLSDSLSENDVSLKALARLEANHMRFVQSDIALSESQQAMWLLDQQLLDIQTQIKDKLRTAEQQLSVIRGKSRLTTLMAQRKVLRHIKKFHKADTIQAEDLRQFSADLEKNRSNVAHSAVEAQLYAFRLMAWVPELMFANTLDALVSVKENNIVLIATSLEKALRQLTKNVENDKQIQDIVISLNDTMTSLIDVMIGEGNSAYELRRRYLVLIEESQRVSRQSDRVMAELVAELEVFSSVINSMNDQAVQSLSQKVDQHQWHLLFSIVGLSAVVFGLGFFVQRRVKSMLIKTQKIANKIAEGDLENAIEVNGNDESSQMMRTLNHMQTQLKTQIQQIEDASAESLRAQQALDNVSSPVLLVDVENRAQYINPAMAAMCRELQEEGAGVLGNGFTVGSSVAELMRLLEEKFTLQDDAKEKQTTELSIGGGRYWLAFSPVLDSQGRKKGHVIEWYNRTQEYLMQSELQLLVMAAGDGKLNGRVDLTDKSGFFYVLGKQLNTLLGVNEQFIGDIAKVMSGFSQGDLTQRLSSGYRGAFAELKQHIDDTADKLLEVTQAIKTNVQAVSHGSLEISKGNESLSRRTEKQAASLEETAQSMKAFTGMVQANTEASQKADALARDSEHHAKNGVTVMTKAEQAMSDIQAASQNIGEITAVINEIAFQTNMLALNAAVEAANAGEQGKGFAVVADAVRQLAARCAVSAGEIKTLVDNSEEKVLEGGHCVSESGQTLSQILLSVKSVSEVVELIAEGGRQQSSGIAAVNQVIEGLQSMTHSNAQLVQQVAVSSSEMAHGAERLSEMVDFFKAA